MTTQPLSDRPQPEQSAIVVQMPDGRILEFDFQPPSLTSPDGEKVGIGDWSVSFQDLCKALGLHDDHENYRVSIIRQGTAEVGGEDTDYHLPTERLHFKSFGIPEGGVCEWVINIARKEETTAA